MFVSCSYVSWMSQYLIPQGPKAIPRKRSTGPEREKRETSQEHRTREEARETTRQKPKRQKGATKARKETGAHGTGSETNRGTPTPQREETTHAQPHRKHARTKHKQAKQGERERESREEREREKGTINPMKQCYTRTTERPRRCIPNYPQHTNHAGTI